MIRKVGTMIDGNPKRGWSLIEVLAAMVIIALGVVLFVKIQGMTGQQSKTSARILKAGHMIEKHLEDLRISIAQDSVAYWPANNSTVTVPAGPDGITLIRRAYTAHSPKGGAAALLIPNVDSLEITTYWGSGTLDTLKVTTYVSKRF